MTIHSVDYASKEIATTQDALAKMGLNIEVGDNFSDYHKMLLGARNVPPLTAPFDPQQQKLSKNNALWLIARNQSGKIVHTQAFRLINLKAQSLAAYLAQKYHQYLPADLSYDLDRSSYHAGPAAKRITGNVLYHGEIWLDDSDDTYKGTEAAALLVRLATSIAMKRFSPDYIFGFMSRAAVFRGLIERIGFGHHEPAALRCYEANSDRVRTGYMVYSSAEDVAYLMQATGKEVAVAA